MFLSNPIVSVVLFLVGMYAVIIGFKTPGYGVEIVGRFDGFAFAHRVRRNRNQSSATLLFILGIALTLIEIKTHVGIFALAGVGMIIVGSFMEFPLPGWELLAAQSVASARQTLILVALVMSGIFGFVVYKVAQARRMRVRAGPEWLIGQFGTVVSALTPRGEVKVEGQIWRAESLAGQMKEGEKVEVVKREGLLLRVKPKQADQ